MIYNVTSDFTKLSETSGTIQNTSRVYDIEVSDKATPDSGIILFGLNNFSFSNQTVYVRCIGGSAEIRVVPFTTDTTSGGASSASTADNFADDNDVENLYDDIFNQGGTSSGGDSAVTDPDMDSELDNIFGQYSTFNECTRFEVE